jgi:hypothetical protein
VIRPIIASVILTETPFDKRHCCWFCGEPSQVFFIFPSCYSAFAYESDKYLSLSNSHPSISIPSCRECQQFANRAQKNTIFAVKGYVKQKLLKRYAKDLAIGVNWTEQELAASEFEQGNFAGFARSAWFMYEVAKGRVSYLGWPLVADGIEFEDIDLEDLQVETFNFDGVLYPSLSDAITHYAKIFLLDEHYVTAVLQHLGNSGIDEKSFAQAVRFCRLLVNASQNERKLAFKALVAKSK